VEVGNNITVWGANIETLGRTPLKDKDVESNINKVIGSQMTKGNFVRELEPEHFINTNGLVIIGKPREIEVLMIAQTVDWISGCKVVILLDAIEDVPKETLHKWSDDGIIFLNTEDFIMGNERYV